jgi:heme exporter protein A
VTADASGSPFTPTQTGPPSIDVAGLGKHFGSAIALDNVGFRLRAGEFLTVFGPNGAGKTTLVRILAMLARPSSGSVRILGEEAVHAAAGLRRRIGLVSHRSLLYASLSARQNLVFFARMFGVEDPEGRAREMLVEMGLEHRMDDPVQTYSRGMEQRCAIARALLHRPDVLLLDEPFSGLDPAATDRLDELLALERLRGRTIVLTSHDLGRGAAHADRVAILVRGRVLFESTTADLQEPIETLYRRHAVGRIQ